MSKDKEKEESGTTSDMDEGSSVQKSLVKKYAYYIASSGESGQIITQVQLKENNYIEWASKIGSLIKEEAGIY